MVVIVLRCRWRTLSFVDRVSMGYRVVATAGADVKRIKGTNWMLVRNEGIVSERIAMD